MKSRRSSLVVLAFVAAGCSRNIELGTGGAASGTTGVMSSGHGTSSTNSGSTSNAQGGSSGASTSNAQGGASSSTSNAQGGASSSTSNAQGGASSTSSGPMCSGFGDICTGCESVSCPDTWCGCDQNPECLAVLQCWGQCMANDAQCTHDCSVQHQSGIAAALLVSDCAATTCDGSCNFGQPAQPCAQCLYKDCADATNACVANPECLPLNQCLQACAPSNIQCQQACYQAHGDGVDTLQALIDCSQQNCQPSCK